MKALVFVGPGLMEWSDCPDPVPGAGEVSVAVRAVGICGSDIHGFTGESGRRRPGIVMGHEATGEVIALGPGVPEDLLGQESVVFPILSCRSEDGLCEECFAGHTQRCLNRRMYGGNLPGAMAERMVVPATHLYPLPQAGDFAHGTLVEPLAVAIHAVRAAGDVRGREVLVAGSGPIGLLVLAALTEAGARTVVMTEPLAERREIALRLGATAAFDPAIDGWRADLAAVTGRADVDVTVDAVGIAATFAQCVELTRKGGTIVALGGWKVVPLDLGRVVAHELHVIGSFNFTREEFAQARRWLAEARFDPRLLVTGVYPLDDGASVFAGLASRRINGIKTVLANAAGQRG
jgi:L-iditol 2-dehydrogenase